MTGKKLTQLTKTSEEEARPAWSPDGQQIAFMQSADKGQTWRIMVMNADGSDATKLAPVNSISEDWSSSGGSSE
jgi:Tol biopolymer transport system component